MASKDYPHLTSSMKVRNIYYKNRVFFSSHNHPMCRANGVITDEGIAYYEARAKGGCAQVSLGETPVDIVYAYKGTVDEHLQINVEPTFAYRARMGKLIAAVHSHNCRIGIQLMHAGETAANPIGPIGFMRPDGVEVRQMDEELMAFTVKSFRDSARMASLLGFDTIQIHGGHGWLLSQFTSPLYNKRTDEYGGSLENRLRFPIRVLKAVREVMRPDMILEYRISGDEFTEGGYTNADACEICAALEPYVDTFQISAGIYQDPVSTHTFPTIFDEHCCNTYLAANIRRHVTKPVIAVGSIMTPEEAEEIIASGKADFVAMARTLIAEPEFVNKLLTGQSDRIVPCVRCFNCMCGGALGPVTELECSVNPRAGLENWIPDKISHTRNPQKIVIVGGGPGGLAAAIFGAEAGHKVVLMEESGELGGCLTFTDYDAHKYDLRRIKDFLIRRARECGAEIRMNCRATPENVSAEHPDLVMAALGADPIVLPLPGMEKAIEPMEVYHRSDEELGDTVVFIGGGLVGCETAYSVACRGKKVAIIEMMDRLAPEDEFNMNTVKLFRLMDEVGVEKHLNATCMGIFDGVVKVKMADGQEKLIPGDTFVNAVGRRPRAEESHSFEFCAPRFVPLGDCVNIGKILQPIRTAYFTIADLG